MSLRLSVHKAMWPMTAPFTITGHVFTCADSILVELIDDGVAGRGEGLGAYYLGENGDLLLDQIEAIRSDIEKGISFEDVQALLPPGGARNALDCALWDLTAKQTGKSIWELTGIDPKPRQTAFTIGIQDTPEQMAENAARAKDYPVLKVKLNDVEPVERMRAIRKARPDAYLVIDANQGFTFDLLQEVIEPFAEFGVSMIEQPLKRGGDEALAGFKSPIPVCADESCLHRGELPDALERYDMINIKLDKTGGLTEALALAKEALAAGKGLMVGNMLGTSLSMAPAFVIAQLCDFVDLDGPLNLKSDCAVPMAYKGAEVMLPEKGLWGSPG
ncbi:N-acetyl-D-Glu racemase DgcA [Henriciella aquimarina]|uniref:N-acetyl-D-Glu racemase DgcA n=1 Tax=Henriciella aquimarina TaxID=545261 RepID=UPI000A0352A5|nr:N-acetyl-D-Glu racemase DgcA [Henriciella aquimarina]